MADQKESFETKDFGWMVAMSHPVPVAGRGLLLARVQHRMGSAIRRSFRNCSAITAKVRRLATSGRGFSRSGFRRSGVTDRCITCHLGYEWSSVLPATIAEPLKPHPMNDWMAKHEFAKFGCTPCHGGDGAATTIAGAHQGGRGWEDPMLSNTLAAQNGLTMNEMMQMRCNFCHRHDLATPGMDEINLAKVLFKKKKCLLCHVVEGRGGATGSELTFEGDRNPELLNFAHVTGEHTMFNWNVQHLTKASAVSPNTQMPDFNFKPEESRALTLMLLSWRRLTYPPEYIPDPEVAAAAMQPSPTSTTTPTPSATPIAH